MSNLLPDLACNPDGKLTRVPPWHLVRAAKFRYGLKKQSSNLMRFIRLLMLVVAVFSLSACASKFKTYRGPEVTSVQVHKSSRKMYLLHETQVLRAFDIGLGFAPVGHKQVEGDGKTPEGAYFINRRNPDSEYHLSIGISYPNDTDRDYAASINAETGGDIFIHGAPNRKVPVRDWTAGCIAVTDKEVEDVYAMVRDGTPIFIYP
jgi:murein L,D-transpeptidase YafK